ncbi:MAG: TauD/TfdA family dioxygenase [Hyphomicrobiaceae bacterium]
MATSIPNSRTRQSAVAMQPAADPAGWSKDDLAADKSWIHELTPKEIEDLDHAVAEVENSGIELATVRRQDFPLPVLGPVLDALKDEVIDGRGLTLIRGVPVQRYTRLQSAIAYWGIGTYIGEPVSQNRKGHLLGHVKDLANSSLSNPTNRGYHTHDKLPFHSDSCDVVGLLCLHPSKSGGESTVVSSIHIYNEMLKSRPDLVAELAKPIYRDRRGEVPEGAEPYFLRPVFNFEDGYLTVNWQGGYIRSAQRFEELPRHSPALTEALDLFASMARELCYHMDFRPGDIQFLHNHVTVHSRTEFIDFDEPEKKRHLLRLWLATPGGRPLPKAMWNRYGPHMKYKRPAGGVIVPGTVLKTPLDAE